MAKNNIEEDIKWIEKIIKKCDDCGLHECIACEICWTEVQAIKHILLDYKRVLKENEQLRTEVNSLKENNEELLELANNKQWISPCYVAQNYTSKQKIKDKIEELKSKSGGNFISIQRIINAEIQVLQELLEK